MTPEILGPLLQHGVIGVMLAISLSFNWYLLKRIEKLTDETRSNIRATNRLSAILNGDDDLP